MAQVKWIDRKNLDKIEKELDYLRKHEVIVGFVSDEADKKVDGVPIWLYASYNEFGTSTIPARPFFRSAINKNRKEIISEMKGFFAKVGTGKMTGEQALKGIGLIVQGMIQESIKNGSWQANVPGTIKAKKGIGQPLIETGSMLRAVSFEIRGK